MILTELENLILMYVPGAIVPSVLSKTSLDFVINKGAEDVNQRLKVNRVSKKFDLVADQLEYDIHTDVADDFMMMDESGLYFYDGTFWQQLLPKTRKYLDDMTSNWRSYASTNKPQYYFVEGNKLTIFPAYNANLTSGGWIYYIGKPVAMTNGDQYPWTGSNTEHITEFDCLDDAIIAYAQWKLSQPLGQKANGVIDQEVYEKRLADCDAILRSRIDISSSRYFRLRGPYAWSGSGSR